MLQIYEANAPVVSVVFPPVQKESEPVIEGAGNLPGLLVDGFAVEGRPGEVASHIGIGARIRTEGNRAFPPGSHAAHLGGAQTLALVAVFLPGQDEQSQPLQGIAPGDMRRGPFSAALGSEAGVDEGKPILSGGGTAMGGLHLMGNGIPEG